MKSSLQTPLFALGKRKNASRSLRVVNEDIPERPRMTLKQLLLFSLNTVQLHASINGLPLVLRGDACQEAPRHLRIGAIIDDLSACFRQLPTSCKDLLWCTSCIVEIPVTHVFVADESKNPRSDPSPEHNILAGLEDTEFVLRVQIEDLNKVARCPLRGAFQSNDVVLGIHQRCLCLHWSLVHRVVVVHVHHQHLTRSVSCSVFDADVLVGLHRELPEPERV
mmetsp:Transcript_2707/g.8125  ORF Transcript_2707/g.8125 Transcript_2707/m.8125 type:complete len:222 (-) Transcript_2707:194-859(-)